MKRYLVLYEDNDRSKFQLHERRSARIIAEYFESAVIVRKQELIKSADILVCKTNVIWEIKSPLGDGKRTIDNNLRNATKQAKNIILDLSRCKMMDEKAVAKTRNFITREHHNIKRLKVILKDGGIIDLL